MDNVTSEQMTIGTNESQVLSATNPQSATPQQAQTAFAMPMMSQINSSFVYQSTATPPAPTSPPVPAPQSAPTPAPSPQTAYVVQSNGQVQPTPIFVQPIYLPNGQMVYQQVAAPESASPIDVTTPTEPAKREKQPKQPKQPKTTKPRKEKKPPLRRIGLAAKILILAELLSVCVFSLLELFSVHGGFSAIFDGLGDLSNVIPDPVRFPQFSYPCLHLLIAIVCLLACLSVVRDAKHAGLICTFPLIAAFCTTFSAAFVAHVAKLASDQSISFYKSISNFFASSTKGDVLSSFYFGSRPYLPVGDGTYSITYEACFFALLLLVVANVVLFYFVNAPLRRAKKKAKKEKKSKKKD